ncbi:DNA translocase FtsK [Niallia endozanthoxylica]|nr:DNA translocase FtsK [Niallia endozanthoxylica]
MKWLLRLFKEDVEHKHIDEDSGHIRGSTKKTYELKQNREMGKEVDAKIVYQYPKGEFRFPLLPDDDKDDDKKIRNRSPHPVEKKKQEQTQERIQKRTKRQSLPDIQEPVIRKRMTEQENKNTRPFKPTDIPSPIFGYKKRPEIQKGQLTHEMEIKDIEKKDPINRELYHRYSQTWGGAPVIVKPSEKRFNPLELNQSKAQVNNVKPHSQVVNLENRNVEIPVEEKIQKVKKAEEPQKETYAAERINQEEIKADFITEELVETVEENVAVPQMDVNKVFENREAENDEKPVLEELESELEAAVLEIAATIETVPASPAIKDETVIDEPALLDKIIKGDKAEQEVVVQPKPNETIKNQEAPVRSTIPFNVIMLNQDKLRLMEQELGKSVSKIDSEMPLQSVETKNQMEKAEQANPTVVPVENDNDKTVIIADQSFQVIANNSDKPTEQTTKTVEDSVQNNRIYEDNEREQGKEQPDDFYDYSFPSINLLTPPVVVEENNQWIDDQKELLNTTLKNFNVGASVVNVTQGPSVTRFEVQPEPGVKVNKITNLADDIKLSLAARDIRIEAPIPGKHTIGIEVPNMKSRPVYLSEIVSNPEFVHQESPLAAALGLDISGKPIVSDLRKMPHGLIAGATGSGKSVCINTILISFLYKARPEDLKLLLIDPKMVELAPYNHIPHLVSPVITDVKAATAALKWAVEEMERRYELFAHSGVRDIGRFNELAEKHKQYADKLPYIVIIIDELADLMMMSPADVEEAICRIAQKARACGIHLIIATQRPSVDVITGLIKANIPTRIAFSVSSQVDSRTIIDVSGAEKLLGRGDMLFLENGSSKPIRLQGTFVSDEEIDDVVAHAREQGVPNYLFEQEELLKKAEINEAEDELFYEACEFVIENGGASSSMLQRRFKIGYNRAARLIDMMESHGYISESRGSKPRDVFITDAELESLQMANKGL